MSSRLLITALVFLLALTGVAHVHQAEGARLQLYAVTVPRVAGGFSTTHPFEWNGVHSSYVQVGSFTRSQTSVQYVRGPSIGCASLPCVPLQQVTSRHYCRGRGSSSHCLKLVYLSVVDLGAGRLGYRSNGADRKLYVETDVLAMGGHVSATYVR